MSRPKAHGPRPKGSLRPKARFERLCRMSKLRCAILDDYQHVALRYADWTVLADRVDVRVLHRRVADESVLASLIGDCGVVVVMRERTPFTKSLLERLPHLKLLVTGGMRNAAIDLDAARAHGVTVCGTASRGLAGRIAGASGDTEAVLKEMGANLIASARIVPSGVVSVVHAQERRFALVTVA